MKPGWLWFYRVSFPVCICRSVIHLWLFFLIFAGCSVADATVPYFNFVLENIRHAAFKIHSASIKLTGIPSPVLEINLDELLAGDRKWRDIRLRCDQIRINRESIDCEAGILRIGRLSSAVTFQLSLQHKRFMLEFYPLPAKNPVEKWQLMIDWRLEKWQGVLKIVNGEGRFLADLLPQKKDPLQIHQAKINGSIRLSGNETSISALSARLDVNQLSFSDSSGLHAGERIDLLLDLDVWQKRDIWQWRGKVVWPDGEVFWQPFYFSGGGHALTAEGTVQDEHISISRGELSLVGVGKAGFSAVASIPDRTLRQARLSSEGLELSTLFGSIIRPLVADTALAKTEAAGQANITWHYQDSAHKSLIVDLQDVSLTDTRERFAVEGLSAHVPLDRDQVLDGSIQFGKARILGIPLGAAHVPIRTNGMRFSIPHAEVPILDGALEIENLAASLQTSDWQWQFNGRLSPISMEKLTESLQVQPMFGTLSGTIPKMSYANSTITMEGEFVSGVFDGVAVARNLVLTHPLGLTPHLMADVDMYHIDLDLLTRAYSFGNIQGRIDVAVHDLELMNWEPVKFDAKLASSVGDYKRRISQAAIKNLVALGGESTVTAIQKSFLGMFEQFRYAEIGWNCKLRGHICYMSGIKSASRDDKGYVLVKGSGIPAITITGYNSEVDWLELLKRLRHAIESGNPVIH
ncbi:hypothetical protein ABO04_07380 [Nitrosomonas sp. HPC101]|nr:hypothetical protein [Nitrosomonas sp. HPC101]MXS85731.1 hypothetical protein [Nitrosomonas sp. HPC101]